MNWNAFWRAARRGMHAERPLRDPLSLLRLAIGMLVATIAGWALHDAEAQLLVTVGAFLGAIAAVAPHNRSRIVAAFATSLAQVVAAAAGLMLAEHWATVLTLLFVLFLIAGLLRAVSMGLSIRVTVITVVLVAFAEIGPSLTTGGVGVTGFFALGFLIMLLAQFLPPYSSRHSAQRRAVAELYRALADRKSEDAALLAAERSLALLRRSGHRELDRLAELVERGEEIGQQLQAIGNRHDEAAPAWAETVRPQLRAIAAAVVNPADSGSLLPVSRPREPGGGLEQALSSAVETATDLAADGEVPIASSQRQVPSPLQLVRGELRWGSPILRHALRLAVVGTVAQVVGMVVGQWLGAGAFLAGHGFWAVVAAALIAFPDFGSTFSRGIGRTIGTIFGVALGIGLSFLPLTPVLHSIVLLLLYYGYLAFRSSGQPYTMFWVVAWIGSLTPGPLGATTRGLDTLIGCLLAFVAYLVFPTWQRRLLTQRLAEWAEATARQLDALVLLWGADVERHRLAVAHADVRARLAGLEVAASATSARHEPHDRLNRWEDGALEPILDAVTSARRQIAALAALAPLWDDEQRRAACESVGRLSSAFDAVALASDDPISLGGQNVGEDRVSADGFLALRQLDRDCATVREVAAAQASTTAAG